MDHTNRVHLPAGVFVSEPSQTRLKCFNSHLFSADPLELEWTHNGQGHHVRLAGSFTDWNQVPAVWDEAKQRWIARVNAPKGKHHFKWVIDGAWTVDEDQPQHNDGVHTNNVLYFYS